MFPVPAVNEIQVLFIFSKAQPITLILSFSLPTLPAQEIPDTAEVEIVSALKTQLLKLILSLPVNKVEVEIEAIAPPALLPSMITFWKLIFEASLYIWKCEIAVVVIFLITKLVSLAFPPAPIPLMVILLALLNLIKALATFPRRYFWACVPPFPGRMLNE